MHQVLKRWGLDGADLPPTVETLERLHRLWLDNVPFENLTKLVRSATALPAAWRREPDLFWRDHLDHGTGGTCFDGTAAYADLLSSIGFHPRPVFCRIPGRGGRSHVALLVPALGAGDGGTAAVERDFLVDIGYALPLPVPLPLPSGQNVRKQTDYYDLIVRRGVGTEFLVLTEDSRGLLFRYSFRPGPVPRVDFVAAWQRTYRHDGPYMGRLALGRFRAGTRFVYKGPNSLFALRRDEQKRVDVPSPMARSLSEVFGLPEALITSGMEILERRGRTSAEPFPWHDLSMNNFLNSP